MQGVRPLYSLVLLLATISTLQCGPIEIVYTGDSCDCPKSLAYVVNVPTPPKHKPYPPSEHGYKLEAPMPTPCKAKVTYTFDFTVQEPKTPSPIEQEKWDLFAKIDRITAHKKDCIAEEGSTNKCSCHRCKASRRYVSPIAMAYKTSRLHPNSLSKTQLPRAHAIAWAAFIKPMDRQFATQLKSRRRRDISRFFLNKRQRQIKKPATNNSRIKQYNRKLRAPTTTAPSDKPKGGFLNPLKDFRNLMSLRSLRNKRDIKGEYDLIENDRDEMDLTLPEIIQYMPETLDPNFKRGRCQFGECLKQKQHKDEEQLKSNITSKDQVEQKLDEANTLTSVDKEAQTQGDNEEKDNDEYKNEIKSSHAKRNADEYDYNPNPINQYNIPVPSAIPYAPTYHPLPSCPPMYNAPHIFPQPIIAVPYGSHPAVQHYPYQMPHSMVDPRTVYAAPLPLPPPPAYMRTAYYSAPPPLPPPPPPSLASRAYSHEYQLDSIIRDIINQHSDFIEAGEHEGGELVDSTDEQKQANKSLFKTLLSGKWQRFVIDDYYGAPKYRRESLTEQPSTE